MDDYPLKPRDFEWERLIGRIAVWVGALLLAWGCANVYWAKHSAGWPTATATIKSSEIAKSWGDDDHIYHRYKVKVHYEYAVDGKPYTGSNIRFAMFESFYGREAEQLVARLKKGRSIRIHYLSWWPSISVIDPGLTMGVAWLPLIGGTMVFVGTAETWRSKRRRAAYGNA